jgi:hypothetical protein
MPDGPRCGATVKRMKPRHSSSRNIGPTVLQCTFSAVAVENHADMFDEIDVVDILAAALNRAPLQCASPFGWAQCMIVNRSTPNRTYPNLIK